MTIYDIVSITGAVLIAVMLIIAAKTSICNDEEFCKKEKN